MTMLNAMKAFLQDRWGLPTTPEAKARRDAERRQERDLATGARSTPEGMDALIDAVRTGSIAMRPVAMRTTPGAMIHPMALTLSTMQEITESRYHALRVETITNGHENFLSTVTLNGFALKGDETAIARLVEVAREAAGAPRRENGLNVPLDPATASPRPRLRR